VDSRPLVWIVCVVAGCVAGRLAPVDPASGGVVSSENGAALETAEPSVGWVAAIPPARDDCKDSRARVRDLERTLAMLTAARKRVQRAEESKAWPDDVPENWRPEGFENNVLDAVAQAGAPRPTFDCTEPPCIARFPPDTTDAEFERVLEALRPQYDEHNEWALKAFYAATSEDDGAQEQRPLFAFSYVLPGMSVEDERARLLMRGDSYARGIESAYRGDGEAP